MRNGSPDSSNTTSKKGTVDQTIDPNSRGHILNDKMSKLQINACIFSSNPLNEIAKITKFEPKKKNLSKNKNELRKEIEIKHVCTLYNCKINGQTDRAISE